MKNKITLIARILLGFVFFAGGIVGLLNLVPPPTDLPQNLQTFNAGLMASGYFMKLLKATETLCGLMLLSGFFVPLALVILAPIVINIFCVHVFMEPHGVPLAVILGVIMIYLSFFSGTYSEKIKFLFKK